MNDEEKYFLRLIEMLSTHYPNEDEDQQNEDIDEQEEQMSEENNDSECSDSE